MRKKKILIDAKSLLGNFSGIGRYTYEVSKFLKQNQDFDIYFSYGYPSKKLKNSNEARKTKKMKRYLSSSKFFKKLVRNFFNICHLFFPIKYSVYWQPNFILNPYVRATKKIISLHDLSFIHYPKSHPQERLQYFKENLQKSLNNCDHIITGSNYIKQEIIDTFRINKSDITVIYHGVDQSIYKIYTQDELQYVKNKFKIPKNFLFFVGSIEPRKNLLNLIKAFQLLPQKLQKEYPLYIAGCEGWSNLEEKKQINVTPNVFYLGYVQDEDLAKLYNLATVFIYPSLYEGFGLPPIEAMACGTPVIVSNTSSMPEICKDASLYINPLSVDNIMEQIETLLNDEMLRNYLIQQGKELVKSYTWEKAAIKHQKVFNLNS